MEEKQKKRLLWQLPFLTLLVIGTILIIRHQQKMPYQKSADFIFGTSYSVIYQCDSDLSQSIKNELMKVDRSLSPFNEHSVITAVNNNQEVVLDKMFQEVFQKAMAISRETDGAFDITVAPLVNAWGFGFKNGTQPDRHQVDSLKEMIGYEKLSLVNGKVQKKDPRMMLDCSAIAKGYGTDMVARLLKERGVQNYIVMAGKKSDDLNERIGYYGEQLVLLAQTLGLNTCWVGLSYSKVPGTYVLEDGEKIACYIALGYGETQGVGHKVKTVEQVSNASDVTPSWFKKGVEAALLAPTAVNQQKFSFELAGRKNGRPQVIAKKGFSMIGYAQLDLGIVKYHFEVGAGKENFEWV